MRLSFVSAFMLSLFFMLPIAANAAVEGVYFQDAKLVGKLIAYNSDRQIYIVYGNVSVREKGEWSEIEADKFIRVVPSVTWVEEEIAQHMDGGVALYGSYNAYGSQIEEEFRATKAEKATSYPKPVNVSWVGFGKTLQTGNASKFNIKKVTDFVNVLAGGRDALAGVNVESSSREFVVVAEQMANSIKAPQNMTDRARRERMLKWWDNNWNFKWLVENNNSTYNKLKGSVGGSSFYIGQLGYANSYLTDVPTTRKDIDNFMRNARGGGEFIEKSGPAIFFAQIGARRDWVDEVYKIVEVNAGGPLFETPEQLAYIKNNSVQSQSWRLEGWNYNRAETLDGQWCWISGERILKYDISRITGKRILVDYYFKIDKTLTVKEFNSWNITNANRFAVALLLWLLVIGCFLFSMRSAGLAAQTRSYVRAAAVTPEQIDNKSMAEEYAKAFALEWASFDGKNAKNYQNRMGYFIKNFSGNPPVGFQECTQASVLETEQKDNLYRVRLLLHLTRVIETSEARSDASRIITQRDIVDIVSNSTDANYLERQSLIQCVEIAVEAKENGAAVLGVPVVFPMPKSAYSDTVRPLEKAPEDFQTFVTQSLQFYYTGQSLDTFAAPGVVIATLGGYELGEARIVSYAQKNDTATAMVRSTLSTVGLSSFTQEVVMEAVKIDGKWALRRLGSW